jgi:hypothetical protein
MEANPSKFRADFMPCGEAMDRSMSSRVLNVWISGGVLNVSRGTIVV